MSRKQIGVMRVGDRLVPVYESTIPESKTPWPRTVVLDEADDPVALPKTLVEEIMRQIATNEARKKDG